MQKFSLYFGNLYQNRHLAKLGNFRKRLCHYLITLFIAPIKKMLSATTKKNFTTSPQLPITWRNEVIGYFKIEKRIKSANKDKLNINFFY